MLLYAVTMQPTNCPMYCSRALIYMYPFNVIGWVKVLLVSGIMSLCVGGIFVGTRWRFWDSAWLKETIHYQTKPNQTDTTKPYTTKPNQTVHYQTKPNSTLPNQTKQ